MDHQRIRPSLADLANLDLDAPAFPELEPGAPPAVAVSRTRPPTILATSTSPPPVPTIPSEPQPPSLSTPPPSKPKSRFALQREKEAAENAARSSGTERFELNLEGDDDHGALPQATARPSLVKDVLERPSTRTAPPQPPVAPSVPRPTPLSGGRATGFPPMGKGVFPRKFDPQPALPGPAFVEPSTRAPSSSPFEADKYVDGESVDGLLQTVSKENEDVLKGMSAAQILEEQRQIREEMGFSDSMIRMLRERAEKKKPQVARTLEPIPTTTPRSRPLPASASPPSRPRPAQPTPTEDGDEEGTPEYIRRHFFPNEPANPALDWMKPMPPGPGAGSPTQASELAILAFDLQGALVENSILSGAIPPAGGDHHVSSSSTFTIPSLLALTASSVPSQRSTAFNTLHRILSHPSDHSSRIGQPEFATLRQQCVQKAGWALRDPSRGVVMASVDLLDHLFASEAALPQVATSAPLPNAEEPVTLLSSFASCTPLPALASQLSLGTLPDSSLLQLLHILVNYVQLAPSTSTSPELDVLFETPKLLESLASRFIAVPWPSSSSSPSLPSPLALSFLTNLARSSRAHAKSLVERNLVESTLRYLAVPPWELDSDDDARTVVSRRIGYDMIVATFELWQVVARYGLGCSIRTQAAPLLEGVFERIDETCRRAPQDPGKDSDVDETRWIGKWLELLTVWTTAAIDPHTTEHDIVWSQVEGWRDVAVGVYEWASSAGKKQEMLVTKSWELLTSWLEGSKVNRSWRGEKEREWVKVKFEDEFTENGGRARRLVDDAMRALERGGGGMVKDAELVSAALRLSQAYREASNPPTSNLFSLDPILVQSVVDSLVARTDAGSFVHLLLLLLPQLDRATRLRATVNTLPLLRAEDAVAARDLIDRLLVSVSTTDQQSLPVFSSLDPLLELPSLVDVPLLRPFFTHAIVTSSGGRVIGPAFPTPRDLKLTASLPPFAPQDPILKPDWPLSVLDELLRSASSPVFQKLPANWDASELQLVKASLVLMRLVSEACEQPEVKPSSLLYDLIKVFMLEKDHGGIDPKPKDAITETDLFRHEAVQHSLSALLDPLTVGRQPRLQRIVADTRSSSSTIERVSALVSTAPFYQLYTDLIGLYDSISLSDRLFGLVLLPPLAMSYPPDYRRLLWTDYSHLLKSLPFTPDQIVSEVQGEAAIASYLYPVETNETMLKAYVDALVSGTVKLEQSPFLAWVAIHHVAGTLFADVGVEVDERAKARLVKTLVGQADERVLRQVIEYRQGTLGEELKSPPECFVESKAGGAAGRVAILKRIGGDEAAVKLDTIFSF